MELFSRVLDKYRKNKNQSNQLKVDRSLLKNQTAAGKLCGEVPPDLSKEEEDAIFDNFNEEQLTTLLRAHCIRQARPWDAPGTDQEVVDEVVAQLDLVTLIKDGFLHVDYYVKLLRPYSQLWNSPGVYEAVVGAWTWVGKASKAMPTLKKGTYKFDVLAPSFFSCGNNEDVYGDKFAGSAIKKAVDHFNGICETIIKANMAGGACGIGKSTCLRKVVERKRDRESFEADFL